MLLTRENGLVRTDRVVSCEPRLSLLSSIGLFKMLCHNIVKRAETHRERVLSKERARQEEETNNAHVWEEGNHAHC